MTRREALRALSLTLTGLWACDTPRTPLLPGTGVFAGGEYLGDCAFHDEVDSDHDIVGRLDGEGLDGRLRLDLARFDGGITPAEEVYVRTRAPMGLRAPPLRVGDGDRGVVLMECAGNGQGEHFGLVSVARWGGGMLLPLLERREGTRVRVTGTDFAERSERGSKPGCSWIFAWDDLSEAFLATTMNGVPLTADHGAPMRLVVPGWYGCCAVKWVEAVDLVPDDAEATPQMREYASRTGQEGVPKLARDYRPARVEPAALPVRVERWRVGGERRIRVVGAAWGAKPEGLEIRIDRDFEAVSELMPSEGWSLWWHDAGDLSGKHTIRMRLGTGRRLASGWYDRVVRV